MNPGIPFLKYVFGKIAAKPGEPAMGGVEPQVTRVTRGFPPDALGSCDPLNRITGTQTLSTDVLVHKAARQQGAFFLLPVRSQGRAYMSAARVCAAPEAEEVDAWTEVEEAYTQYSVFLFEETDWADQAPWLLATLPRWLRAEPTPQQDFEQGQQAPMETVPAGPDQFLLTGDPPFPSPTSKVWDMLCALECQDRPAILGPGDGFRHEKGFCNHLARAAALLPPHLRIYLTVAGGSAAVQEDCAIQFVPDGSRGRPRRPVESGYLHGIASKNGIREFTAWGARLGQEDRLDQLFDAQWSTPGEARKTLAETLTSLNGEKSIYALERFLSGQDRKPPRPPVQPEIRVSWLRRLDRDLHRIEQGGFGGEETQDESAPEPADRAIQLTAHLNGSQWASCWHAAVVGSDPAEGERLLAWSALRSETEEDGAINGTAVGEIPSFRALGLLLRLSDNHRSLKGKKRTKNSVPLPRTGFATRMKQMPVRAPQLLVNDPFDLIALAELGEPSRAILAPEQDTIYDRDDWGEQKPLHSQIEQTIALVRHAASFLVLEPPQSAARNERDFPALVEVAETVLERSFPGWRERDAKLSRSRALLGFLTYHQHSRRQEGRRFWQSAFASALYLGSKAHGLHWTWKTLFGTADNYRKKNDPGLDAQDFFDQALGMLAENTKNEARLLSTMLEECEASDTNRLVPASTTPGTGNALGKSMQDLLWRLLPVIEPIAVRECLAAPATALLSKLARSRDDDVRNLALCTDLADRLFARLAACGPAGREATLHMLAPLERLHQDHSYGVDPRNPSDQVKRLSRRLKECVLSWADGPEPYLTPFSLSPLHWDRNSGMLVREPIRYHLALSMGYPGCIYCGHVAVKDQSGDAGQRDLACGDNARRDILIARCAVLEWKGRFHNAVTHETWSHYADLKVLLTRDRYRPATVDALNAIRTLARSERNPFHDELGPDLIYAVELLDMVSPEVDAIDALSTPRADEDNGSTPEEMRRALFAETADDFEKACFGSFLASITVENRLGFGTGFHGFLSVDHEQARGRFRFLLLGRPASSEDAWEAFDALPERQLANRLDRVLFLLHLWAVINHRPGANKAHSPQDHSDVFELPDGPRAAVTRFLNANSAYESAFRTLFARNEIDTLPGWPVL